VEIRIAALSKEDQPYFKSKAQKRKGVDQVVKHLPNNHQVLSSNPYTKTKTKTKKKRI
jgi:hypothetical protein